MHVLRFADCRRMPWKNGGGETAEVAVYPAAATLDTFEWRVSMATVASDGPFSAFAGADRTLAIIDGEGLRLHVAGRVSIELRSGSPPYAFAADMPASASLIAGPVTDLNVMTRRSSYSHAMRRLELQEELVLDAAKGPLVVVCASGRVRATRAGETCNIGARDSLIVEAPRAELRLRPEEAAWVFIVELSRVELAERAATTAR